MTVLAGIAADPRIGGAHDAAELRVRWELPAEGAHDARGRGPGHGPADARHARRHRPPTRPPRIASRRASREALGGTEGRTIGLLGLAFKAGTDDIRDSPAVGLAERLIAGGATVRGYDPAAGPNAQARVPALQVVDDPWLVVDGADAVVIATEWPVFRELPWTEWAASGERPLIIDGRRLLDPARMRADGYDIIQLGDGRQRIASAGRVG